MTIPAEGLAGQRQSIREQLRAQRQAIAQQLSRGIPSVFPRSVTMRVLLRQPALLPQLVMLIVGRRRGSLGSALPAFVQMLRAATAVTGHAPPAAVDIENHPRR